MPSAIRQITDGLRLQRPVDDAERLRLGLFEREIVPTPNLYLISEPRGLKHAVLSIREMRR